MERLGQIFLLQVTAAQPPRPAARELEQFLEVVTHYQTELH